ncbi:hypothetical protein ACOMHN_065249 [Nucella lapillus]
MKCVWTVALSGVILAQWVWGDCVKTGPCSCEDPEQGVIDLSALDGHGSPRTLLINLQCDQNEMPGSLSIIGETPGLRHVMTLKSHYCCYGGGKAGLSVGSILVIVFFSLLLVYLVAGVMFMKFARKAEGREVVPNYSIWTAIPGLIKDGVLFTFRRACSLCGRRGTYDKV